jgi:hypothetical protein
LREAAPISAPFAKNGAFLGVPSFAVSYLDPILDPIAQPVFATFARAIGAAKYFAASCFHAVPDNFTPAMIAGRGHHVDGALEAIKDVRIPVTCNFERLVVIVSAMFAFSHINFAPF